MREGVSVPQCARTYCTRPKARNDGEDGLEHGEEACRAYKSCKVFNMEQVSMATVVTSPPHTFTSHIWTLLNIVNFPLSTVVSIFKHFFNC